MVLNTDQATHYSRFSERDLSSFSASQLDLPLPSHPSPRGPSPLPQSSSPRPGIHIRRLKVNPRYAITPRITLLTLLVVVPTSVLAAAFCYVLFNFRVRITDGYIATNVPLFIGTITSTIMSILSTVVMILFAFRVGQMWINIERSQDLSSLPTADQFSLLMKMCSGGSLFVMLEFLLFASPFEAHPNGVLLVRKANRQKIKPILKWTSIVFGVTIFLTLAVQAADVWVHKRLESVTFAIVSNDAPSIHNYSRVLRPACFQNDTDSASIGLNGHIDTSCVFGSDGFLYDPIETFATLTNTSNVNAILNDGQIAYIAPAETSPSVTFMAETIGLNATCKAITSECTLAYPSSGYASFTCGSGYEALTGLMYADQIFQISMLNGTDVVNPFWIGGFGCFKDYASTFPSISAADFLNVSTFNTGIYVGLLQSCTIQACEVRVANLNYSSAVSSYINSTTTTNNYTLTRGDMRLSDVQTTKALVGAISQSYGVDQISLGVTAAAVRANTSADFSTYVAQSIAQVILGVSAGAFVAGPTSKESRVINSIGTKTPLVPIIVFVGFQLILVLFCVMIAAVSIGVDRSDGAQAVKNARHGLIDVKPLITEHFGDEAVYPPSELRTTTLSNSNLPNGVSMRSRGNSTPQLRSGSLSRMSAIPPSPSYRRNDAESNISEETEAESESGAMPKQLKDLFWSEKDEHNSFSTVHY